MSENLYLEKGRKWHESIHSMIAVVSRCVSGAHITVMHGTISAPQFGVFPAFTIRTFASKDFHLILLPIEVDFHQQAEVEFVETQIFDP